MCLSMAYKLVPDADAEKICEYVSKVAIDGDKIVLTDIMGAEIEVQGHIKSMDFVNSKIMIGA